MDKKRSIGLTILGILIIAESIYGLYNIGRGLFLIRLFNLRIAVTIIAALSYIICGFGVLRLYSWARITGIIISYYYIVATFIPVVVFQMFKQIPNILMPSIIRWIWYCFVIFYLTRPKVKEQFK